MPIFSRLAIVMTLVAPCLLTACGGGDSGSPTGQSGSPTTFISIVSSPGDQMGNGFTQRAGLTDGTFSARVDYLAGNRIGINVEARASAVPSQWWWLMRFTMPPGQPLVPGTYEGATNWGSAGIAPGMDVSGNGRSCGFLTGRFVITEVALGPSTTVGAPINRLHMTFEQRCTTATAPLRGEISIVANPWR